MQLTRATPMKHWVDLSVAGRRMLPFAGLETPTATVIDNGSRVRWRGAVWNGWLSGTIAAFLGKACTVRGSVVGLGARDFGPIAPACPVGDVPGFNASCR